MTPPDDTAAQSSDRSQERVGHMNVRVVTPAQLAKHRERARELAAQRAKSPALRAKRWPSVDELFEAQRKRLEAAERDAIERQRLAEAALERR